MTLTLSSSPAASERARAGILTSDALALLEELHNQFDPRRRELLTARLERAAPATHLPETHDVRADDRWRVAPPTADYADRRVEITGPADRKLVINALNSGAKGFMADFEDATSPTWRNQTDGHVNLVDAIERTITYDSADGRHYRLHDDIATLLVRPRGWHLPEPHVRDGDDPVAGALVDFGLFAFHNARRLVDHGAGLYLYLPKLEHHLEARLWDDVFTFTEGAVGVPRGTIRATALIETLPAAFQMDEILFELRDHSYGLNAGRWDYIFSMIKTYRDGPEYVLPDRDAVTMTVPFMRAYTELLIKTCHRRGAFAMGGMSALIPSRTDPVATARAAEAVRADKQREAAAGFDGTWVAHPDTVPIATAAFDEVLGERQHQIERQRPDVEVTPADLLDVSATPGRCTEAGLRKNVNVAFRYISFWLSGRGAAAIDHLMEDTATAEICRSQVWQWIRHGVRLEDGRVVTRELVTSILDEEMRAIREAVGPDTWERGRPQDTKEVFVRVALADELPPFLTLVGLPFLA